MTVTSFKLASVGRSDIPKRINGSYSDMIENRQMISRAVTECVEHFHLEDGTVAIDNGDAQHKACHGRSLACMKKKIVENVNHVACMRSLYS